MTTIKYDIGLNHDSYSKTVMVNLELDERYVIQKGGKQYLFLSDQTEAYWEWLASSLHLKPLALRYKSLMARTDAQFYVARQVINDKSLLDNHLYLKYIQGLFASFRSGMALEEMVIKLQGFFMGPEWSDYPDILGASLDSSFKGTLLTCTIEPTHATVQSILPPYDVKRKKRLDVKTWKPADPTHYAVVWHLLVTLSNGAKYKMDYPISSLNQWHETVQHYFEANPLETVSPNVICHVTNHPEAYRYETILERLNYYQEATQGISASEILIKLSAFLFFPERAAHLQTILTGKEVELVFSGNVHWY